MRIEFRAWDKKKNRYEPNYLLAIDEIGDLWRIDSTDAVDFTSERNRYIIEQFTGVTDKNEEEIFQGDIVKSIPDGNVYEIDWFDDKCGWFGFENTTGEDYIPLYRLNCVKIGNIHEDKELLNGND